jgi:hypothetical protein
LFQEYGAFNFGYQNFFLDLTIINSTKLRLCNIIFKTIINFIIYIERSMSIFIIYIGIIGPLSHFDHTNFKSSLVIKMVNFSEILNGPLSYACHLTCECDYLSKLQFITHLSSENTIN